MATVAALRADDHAARRRLAARSRAAHLETLADRIRELRPWEGDVQQLVELAVPEAGTIERWKIAAAEVQKQIDRHEGEVERLTTERLRLRAELDAIGSVVGVVSDQEAKQRPYGPGAGMGQSSPNARRCLRRCFRGCPPARRHRYERAFGHTAALAKLHQMTQALAVLEVDLSRAHQLRGASETALQRVREEIAGALRAMTPACRVTCLCHSSRAGSPAAARRWR